MDFSFSERKRPYIFDGGTGSVFFSMGLEVGQEPFLWNLSNPEKVLLLHRQYIKAGADIIKTNTFGANPLKTNEYDTLIRAAVKIAKNAAKDMNTAVFLDIGPCGRLLYPLGDLDFEDAVTAFGKMAQVGEECGADGILIETMGDIGELKSAVLGAKEHSRLPIFATCTFGSDGKMMTGASPECAAVMLDGLGVDALGVNCSVGPAALVDAVRRMASVTDLPIIANPNAGLPTICDGKTVYSLSAGEFAQQSKLLVEAGASFIGGCCGTTPDYIKALKNSDLTLNPRHPNNKNTVYVSSYTHICEIGSTPVLIGERINPTGKKALKEALREHRLSYIEEIAVTEQKQGAHLLDVNAGLPEVDETKLLCELVEHVQSVSDLPLQIDTSSVSAMEKALRHYRGKALVNSVCGKAESMASFFPLVKKYGGAVICLTLDENGVPDTAEKRVEIAQKIVNEAATYGIDKNDLIFDPLALTVSSDSKAAEVTLQTLTLLKERLGVKCSLGISNVSYGLPNRDLLNASFLLLALARGLDAAIVNPSSEALMNAYRAFSVLDGKDEGCKKYISDMSGEAESIIKPSTKPSLYEAILSGISDTAYQETEKELTKSSPFDIVNKIIIPALGECGALYESGKLYLPQLLGCAEAAKQAFGVISSVLKNSGTSISKGKVIMATVQGDIHDIGKNIVCTVLSSYGYDIIDLGRDTAPQKILDEIKNTAPIAVGLSALMTTTVPSMAHTVKIIKEKYPNIPVMVGGAVLTEEYAKNMGADVYCADALSDVRFLESLT